MCMDEINNIAKAEPVNNITHRTAGNRAESSRDNPAFRPP